MICTNCGKELCQCKTVSGETVKHMIEEGLLERVSEPDENGNAMYGLTEKGKKWMVQ